MSPHTTHSSSWALARPPGPSRDLLLRGRAPTPLPCSGAPYWVSSGGGGPKGLKWLSEQWGLYWYGGRQGWEEEKGEEDEEEEEVVVVAGEAVEP